MRNCFMLILYMAQIVDFWHDGKVCSISLSHRYEERVNTFHNDFVKLIFSFNSIWSKKSAKIYNEKENLADHRSWLSQTFRFRESNASSEHQAWKYGSDYAHDFWHNMPWHFLSGTAEDMILMTGEPYPCCPTGRLLRMSYTILQKRNILNEYP